MFNNITRREIKCLQSVKIGLVQSTTMFLIKRKSNGVYTLGVFIVISLVCRCSTANDYICKPDEVQFKCQKDGKCIPKTWECDGENDCVDKSDEMQCSTCDDDKFSCDGKCINKQWLCDGHADCKDQSDEAANLCANVSCHADEFKCVKSSVASECILKSWVCDHDYDCEDGSDEVNCPVKQCSPEFFQCENHRCIDKKWHCDHDDDCDDKSDEKNCTYSQCDKKSEFQCSDKRCIQKEAFCDNIYDCEDHSDEPSGCLSTVSHSNSCPDDRFDCKDGSCIKKQWRCDGVMDCTSQDDEKNCSSSCEKDQFKCEVGNCISKSSRCNGSRDCLHGSDEKDCDPALFKCKENEFKCRNHQCINQSLVCDDRMDCNDGSDEDKSCGIDECASENKGGCEQKCQDLPIGYRCNCVSGYELADNRKKCKAVNACKEFGKCSQICMNREGGGHKCGCVAGYRLERKDQRTCKAIERHPYLVFSDHASIRMLMLHKSQFSGIVPHLAGIIAVDYHFGANLMYWTDMKNKSIQRTSLKGEKKEQLKETVITDIRSPDGIAVDWVTGKLYWSDAWGKRIEVSDMHGRYRRALVTTDIDMPRAVVLHPYHGEMFWTDWGKKPKIERCGMDGDPTSRKAIIRTRIQWPNALTIDYTIDSIWWVDAKLDVIEHCDLNGENRRVILAHDKIYHPFSISVFEDHVYWSDWHKTAIYKANKFTGKNVTVLKQGLVNLFGISMIHPQRQPASFNFCQEYNGGCSHLCLLSARYKKMNLFSCACREGINMLADNKTCNTTDALLCEKGRCNNGTCIPGNNLRGPICQCKEGYTGARCETKIFQFVENHGSDSSNANAVTIGISLGVVAIIFILFGIVGFTFYRKIQKRYVGNPNSLKFRNPVYEETTVPVDAEESGGSLLPSFLLPVKKEPFAGDEGPPDMQ